jgi:cytidyltransferase-like protein
MDFRAPIFEMPDLAQCVRVWRAAGKSVALCHGRFDPLHVGHILHFEEARTLADVLVVTITADAYAQSARGRPFLPEHHRAISVASQRSVSGVAISNTSGAVPILEVIQPDIYVKGQDYVGSAHQGYLEEVHCANELGIRVCTTTSEKFSATNLLRKITDEMHENGVSS